MGGVKVKSGPINNQTADKKSDHFTIFGKTNGFKDSTILYLNNSSGSLNDNIDSTYVLENTFTFKGSVSEPSQFKIHTGYTGWSDVIPKDFFEITFFVSNTPIYLDDEIGNLKCAKLSGSELQDDWNDFVAARRGLLLTNDSIQQLPASSPRRLILQRELMKYISEDPDICLDFIKTHPNSFISIDLLNGYKSLWGAKKTKDLFTLLGQDYRNTIPGKSIEEYIKIHSDRNYGDFVDLELKDLNGELVKLSSLKGNMFYLTSGLPIAVHVE